MADFPCVAIEGVSNCIHGCPEHMATTHPVECQKSCCRWPKVLLSQIGLGRCSKCGNPWDDHRLIGVAKPLEEPICPGGKRAAA